MQNRFTLLALVLLAGLAALGLARMPARSSPDGGSLLISSTIGASSAFLFVVDPATRNLAVYEATPGDNGGLRLLGSRKIEHDLELAKYRDRSEYSYFDLRDKKNEVGGDADDAKRSQKTEQR